MHAQTDRYALNSLLELVRSPRPRPACEVVRHDWSRLPRIQALAFSEMEPLDFVAVATRARAFLVEACSELDVPGRDRRDATHPLDILRMHNLEEGATWDSIIAYREENGLPRLSPRTLRNRQNEAITLLLEWAGRPRDKEQAVEAQGDAAAASANERSKMFSWRRATLTAVALGVSVLVLVLALRGSGGSTSQLLNGADRQFLGKSFSARLVEPHKDEPWLWRFASPSELPPLDGEYQQATITERDKRQYVYLGSGTGGTDHTTVLKWDPVARKILWKHQLHPPVEERWTHKGVLREPMDGVRYLVRWLVAGASPGRETSSIVAVLWSRYSPTFVYFLDRDSGVEIGHYVHPGALYRPIVVDIDGDGRGEVILGGVDNARENPDFVILRNPRGSCSASDVLWNEGGQEGAEARILFPDVPELRAKMELQHCYVFGVTTEHFNRKDRCLHLSIGTRAGNRSLYLADVYCAACRIDSVRIRFAEVHQKLWASVGMSLNEARSRIESGTKVLQSADVTGTENPENRTRVSRSSQ